MADNVFSHQLQGRRVAATIIGPSAKKKSLIIFLGVAFFPGWVDRARSIGRARLCNIAGGIEEADVTAYLSEVSAPRVGLAKTLTLFRASDLEASMQEDAEAACMKRKRRRRRRMLYLSVRRRLAKCIDYTVFPQSGFHKLPHVFSRV